MDDLPFIKAGPSSFHDKDTQELYMTKGGEKHSGEKETIELLSGERSRYSSVASTSSITGSILHKRASLEKTMQYAFGRFSEGDSLRRFRFFVEDEKPSDQHELYDIQINTVR